MTPTQLLDHHAERAESESWDALLNAVSRDAGVRARMREIIRLRMLSLLLKVPIPPDPRAIRDAGVRARMREIIRSRMLSLLLEVPIPPDPRAMGRRRVLSRPRQRVLIAGRSKYPAPASKRGKCP